MVGNSLYDEYGWTFKKTSAEQEIKAPYIVPTDDDAAFSIGGSYFGHYIHQLNMDKQFGTEVEQILRYRELAIQSEVDAAVTDICNEAISGEDDATVVRIILDDMKIPENIKSKIFDEWDKCLELLDFAGRAYEIFRTWYVDGRITYHKIIDPKRPKDGLKELRYIPSINIKKVREEKFTKDLQGNSMLVGYDEYFLYSKDMLGIAKNPSLGFKIPADSIAFAHSGLIDEKQHTIYSYLQKAIKPANQLRIIEDATLIYRLARAPERRVIYVDVGTLPKNKAEEYLKSIMTKFKNKMVYDAVTGEVKDAANTLSMLEDFWLPRREGGKGTQIETLPGGQSLGQIDDVEYFRKRLYQSLNVPIARLTGDTQSTFGGASLADVSREEMKFSKFVSRLRHRFVDLFKDILRTQLLLKQVCTKQDWEVWKERIKFKFETDSHFKEMVAADVLTKRLSLLELITPYVGKYFSNEQVRKEILMQSDDDIKRIDAQIKKERAKEEAEAEAANAEMGNLEVTPDGAEDDDEDDDKGPPTSPKGNKPKSKKDFEPLNKGSSIMAQPGDKVDG